MGTVPVEDSWPDGAATFGGVALLPWLQKHVIDDAFLGANVVQLVSGNRDLAEIDHYQHIARLQVGRTVWASCD